MSIETTFIKVKGVRTRFFHASASGSPVLLLHGGGADSAILSWELAIEPLARHHRVIAPDLPGYGETDCPNVKFSNTYYTEFLIDFMKEVGLTSACVAGLSLGGAIALQLCLSAPQRVEKLVLVSSFGLQPRAPLHKLGYVLVRIPGLTKLTWALLRIGPATIRLSMRNVVHNADALTDDLVNTILLEARKPPVGRAFRSYHKSSVQWKGISTYFMPLLKEIRVPTLIVHGAEDRLVPLTYAEQAHALIPRSELFVMRDCGHWPPRENPAEFNKRLEEFLADRYRYV
jgi:pimeloyl-ACP methyl ester carboxylesterase